LSTQFNPTDPYTLNSNQPSNSTANYSGMSGPSSQSGFQFPDFSGIAAGQRGATQGLLGNQNQQVGGYLQNYSNAINSQETQPAMWARLAQETGYQPLMNQANTLNSQLAAIPQTYSAATRGFDVNANQLDRIMNMQQWKLAPLAERATAQAQTAGQFMQGQITAAQAQQQKELQPYQSEQTFLQDKIARETSLFSEQNQSELQALEYKMQTGAQLSSDEQKRMNDLRIAQEGYKNELAKATIGAQNQMIPYGSTYYNPVTQSAYNPSATVRKP
jgi:hypothetical protein